MEKIRETTDLGTLQSMKKSAPPPASKKKEDTEAGPKDTKLKEKLTKSPPKELTQELLKPETNKSKESKEVSISVEDSISEESEGCEEMQEGMINLDRYEYVTGAQIRMKNAIAE